MSLKVLFEANVTASLLLVILAYFSTILAKFFWHRRQMSALARNVPCHKGLPIIGCAHQFFGKSIEEMSIFFINLFKLNNNISKMWLGHKLFYLVSNPKYFETILNHSNVHQKCEFIYKHAHSLFGEGLISASVEHWKRDRKYLAPTFSQKNMNQFPEVIARHGAILCEVMLTKLNSKEDIFRRIFNSTYDMISETLFNYDARAQETNTTMGELLHRYSNIMCFRAFKVTYAFDFFYKRTELYKDEMFICDTIRGRVNKMLKEKKQEYENRDKNAPNKQKHFTNAILEKYYANVINDEELTDQAVSFLLAGSHTNATSLCFILSLLGMHPDIQSRVFDEITSLVGSPSSPLDLPTLCANLSHFHLVECVIRETLRLFPGVGFIGRTATDDIRLDDDITVPKGAEVFLGILSMQRDPAYWNDPLKFDPDRFMTVDGKERNYHPYAWLPFSGGSRNCVGMKMGMMVLKMMTIMIVREFRVECGWKGIEGFELAALIIPCPKDGFELTVEKRQA